MKAHCLFEQSGTFKNEFIKLGIEAEDYDILNDFGQTDHQIDLFKEIRGGYNGEPSLFDKIGDEDIVMAFFPCIRFEAQIQLSMRGDARQQKKWSMPQKIEYSMKLNNELNEMYTLVSMLAHIAYTRELRLIIENPYSEQHYLTRYWCVKPSLIDKNRQIRNDYYEKPTQYWFINCEPQNNFEWFDQIEGITATITDPSPLVKKFGVSQTVARSMIAPEYANRFIREFII